VWPHKSNTIDLVIVWYDGIADLTEVHVTKFVFRAQFAEFCLVTEFVNKLERRFDVQFIPKPPLRGHDHRFTMSRVTADTV